MKLNKYLSNATGFSLAVVNNFYLNCLWTFKRAEVNVIGAFWIFLLIALFGLLLNSCLIYLLHENRKINFYKSKAVAIFLVFCWNFSANYFFNFQPGAK